MVVSNAVSKNRDNQKEDKTMRHIQRVTIQKANHTAGFHGAKTFNSDDVNSVVDNFFTNLNATLATKDSGEDSGEE